MKPKLIFLSGLLCDATVWQPQLDFFAKTHDVQAIDFKNLDHFEKMAHQVIEQMHTPCIMVGHSMGARVALEVYRRVPQLITHLALLDFGIHATKEGEAEKRERLIQATREHGMAYLIPNWLEPMVYAPNIAIPEIFDPMKTMVLSQDVMSFEAQIQALLQRPEVQSLFSQINIPLYLGVGRQDQWSTLAQHQAMLELNPKATLAIYENSGHMSPLEAATQVNLSLNEWLKAH